MANGNGYACPPGQQGAGRGGNTELLKAIIDKVSRPGEGALLSHVRDVREMARLNMVRLDVMPFQFTASASTVTQPASKRVPKGYYFEIFGLVGWFEVNPASNADFAHAVNLSFNAREGGAQQDVFANDQDFATYVASGGQGAPLYFDRGLYVFGPGADVSMTFAKNSSYNPSTGRRGGINFIGNLIHESFFASK